MAKKIHAISKQIERRARMGKIFARWHLAIGITSFMQKDIFLYSAITLK